MGDERGDDAAELRIDAALTIVLVVLLLLDVVVPDYHVSSAILLPLLGTILALLGLEASAFWKNVR